MTRRGYKAINESDVATCEHGTEYTMLRSSNTGRMYRALVERFDGPHRVQTGGQAYAVVFRFPTCNCGRTPRPTVRQIDASAIRDIFNAARAHLRFPKVTFVTSEGETVQFRLVTRGANDGRINVTDGRRYPENIWYGRIETTGAFVAGRAATPSVVALIQRFAADPATVAGEVGRLSGSCVFCRRELTDERSTTVGYGPICAGHYGLPWGEVGRSVELCTDPTCNHADCTSEEGSAAAQTARGAARRAAARRVPLDDAVCDCGREGCHGEFGGTERECFEAREDVSECSHCGEIHGNDETCEQFSSRVA